MSAIPNARNPKSMFAWATGLDMKGQGVVLHDLWNFKLLSFHFHLHYRNTAKLAGPQ